MKRVLVIGCPGSGKSTFARALAERTGLPLCHLDLLYWNADKTTVPRDTFRARLSGILSGKEWIIDGNYQSTLALRLSRADTVFFLDYPTDICLAGVTARRSKPRPDMPWIEEEADDELLAFVRDFSADARPQILNLLSFCTDKSVYIFHTREDADAFFCDL